MKNKLINQLAYVALIITTLICFGCIDTDQIPEILTPGTQDPVFEPLPTGEGLSIGETAPVFSLPDADGNLHSLSNYAGQKVVLVFYATGS